MGEKQTNKQTKRTPQLSRITFRWIGLHLPSVYKRSGETQTVRKSDERRRGNTKIDTSPAEINGKKMKRSGKKRTNSVGGKTEES